MVKSLKTIAVILAFSLTVASQTVRTTASQEGNNTFTGQNTLSAYKIDKRIWVDGVKYPITKAGIQAALTDACAGNLGGAAAGTWVYLPPMDLTVTGTGTDQFLITCSLHLEGAGQYATRITVSTSNSTTPVFLIQPTSTASQLRGSISGIQITGDGTGGDGIVFDGSNVALGASGGPNGWDIHDMFITGLAASAHSINLVTCTVTCNQGYFHVWDSQLNHGTKWTGSAGDSIFLEHNVFTANGVTTACAEVTLQTGSAQFTMFANNGACTGGFFIIHKGSQPKLLYNQIEQTEATTEANSAVVDIAGDTASVAGAAVVGNNINTHDNATDGIRIDTAANTRTGDNTISVKATTGIGINNTANASGTVFGVNNVFTLVGGAAISGGAKSLNDLGLNSQYVANTGIDGPAAQYVAPADGQAAMVLRAHSNTQSATELSIQDSTATEQASINHVGQVRAKSNILVEGTAPSAVASQSVCYADSTAHALKCSYNNDSFTQVGRVSGTQNFNQNCNGVATAGSTLFMPVVGSSTMACTDTTGTLLNLVSSAGTVKNLFISCGVGGVNASSGVFTLLKNGVAQTVTCTTGTGSTCNDTTHSFTVAAGDKLKLQFTTQAAETLANCTASYEKW